MDSGEEEYYYYSDEDEYSMGDASEKKQGHLEHDEHDEGDTEMEEADGNLETKENRRASSTSVSSTASTTLKPGAAGVVPEDYIVLTPELLELEQEKLVKNVSEVLDIDFDTANVLLLHFRWNKEKLFDSYYADSFGTCEKAGAVSMTVEPAGMEADAAAGRGSDDSLFTCQILFVDVPLKETFAMPCGHRFSLDAWQNYLCAKVEDGKDCIFARCPSDGCKATVSPKNWTKILTATTSDSSPADIEKHKEALSKYKKFLASSFVEINRTMRYCPGKNCTVAIKSMGATTNVKCTECGSLFCFKCGQEAHAPTSCTWLALWQEKCMNESETANWILAHTKKCPKCATRIEKNQGCNHMQCKVCKFDFCWICMGSWTEHGSTTGGYYNCNRYRSSGSGGDDKASKAKQELDRYLHFYKRYDAHKNAGKFATEQRERAEKRMVEMQTNSSLGWVDVQFLIQAVEQLIDCRRVLMNTYIHAYYLPDGPKKELFEYLQSLLESHTEKLSELSEKDLAEMDRSEVINYTRVTGKFLQNLLEQVDSEGIGMDEEIIASATNNTSSSPPTSPSAGAAASSSSSSSTIKSTPSSSSGAKRAAKQPPSASRATRSRSTINKK